MVAKVSQTTRSAPGLRCLPCLDSGYTRARGIASMRLDVLGRALRYGMRCWRSMLLADQCVLPPPLVLLAVLLVLCVCVCVCAPCCLLRQALLQPSNPYVQQQITYAHTQMC